MWTIGKKIICIKSHSQGVFKENDVFTLKGIYKDICKCPLLKFDIGFKTDKFIGYCPSCKEKNINEEHYRGIWLFNENLFKPLDETYAEEVLENIMENIKKEELCEL
jgi:hypothetical protein